MGAGPMTGRGAGFCAGYEVPRYMNPTFGRGFGGGRGRGFGMGGGRGWRHQYYATGLPGWARGYGNQYPNPEGYAVDPREATIPKMARDEELAYLKDQARYFETALDDVKTRVNELQQQAADSSKE